MKKPIKFQNIIHFEGLKSCLILLFFMAGFVFTATSQVTSKQDAAVNRLQMQVDRARVNAEKQERRMEVADSLIAIGTSMQEESSEEIKTAVVVMKSRKKEYSSQRKALEKRLKSKSREDVAEAKAEIKKLDADYKTEIKGFNTIVKTQTKKSTDATKNLDKGKVMKKEAGKALKEASKNLTNAEYALDEASGVLDMEVEGKGKKGKKK